MTDTDERRTDRIIEVLTEAFAGLMESDPAAFRVKYRKMAMDPFAFYRGTACLFYADLTEQHDDWVDDSSSRIWIHGDLHAENFGTYMNSDGRLVFDVNDFDEAYIGHFTWDLKRFAASLALMCWRKALPIEDVRRLVGRYLQGYLTQVDHYRQSADDEDFSLNLDNTEGPIRELLEAARLSSRVALLDAMTSMETGVRLFRERGPARRLEGEERGAVEAAFAAYLETIPEGKRVRRDIFYDVRDLVATSGFGIGSAGLPAFTVLVEGFNQAQDNDVVLSMKQANVPAVSRFVDRTAVESYFKNEAHRTVVSQRALQVHTDAMLGWTTIDSDQSLVTFQVEEAVSSSLEGRREEFVEAVVDFALECAGTARRDHALFVEAFRAGRIGISST